MNLFLFIEAEVFAAFTSHEPDIETVMYSRKKSAGLTWKYIPEGMCIIRCVSIFVKSSKEDNMNKKICTFLIALSVILAGCGKEKIEYFDTSIFKIEDEKFYVSCPIDDGPGDDIGYYCAIKIDSEIMFKDIQGNELKHDDYKIGDSVRVVLTKPQILSKKDVILDVREIKHLAASD